MLIQNRLSNEKSPYLLQHAYNPVDWYPWGDEAFKKAREENKPIFLSIGYSTCYWCHVMEREVFEQDSMAELMNKFFVNIKVDREERPDVDRVYMSALQAMTGSGGWPMSMFLTPELKPFYGATYVPPTSKYGMPGFDDLIIQIDNAWKTRRQDIENSGNEIIDHIRKATANVKTTSELTDEPLKKGFEQCLSMFDDEVAGFGNAPRFPRPVMFNFLLRAYKRYNEENALNMTAKVLYVMSKGGIHDHLGGGFHRYSVDKFWVVPHFEKMLYDQAQLVISYLETYQITNEKFFASIAEDILYYVSNKLTAKDGGVSSQLSRGGFYSAEDAESALDASNMKDKEEGTFYVWEMPEIEKLLG
ncbi:MAG: thioredoxin domain-containing protein, partial [Ignavibacteriae bacterium]